MIKAEDTVKDCTLKLYMKDTCIYLMAYDELLNIIIYTRIKCPKFDKLVAYVKKVFIKSPYCVIQFKTDAPNILLPPKSI